LPATPGDTLPAELERSSAQAGIRAAYTAPMGTLTAGLRYRDAAFLPRTEASVDADLGVGPARVTAELSTASWAGHDAATSYSVYGELGRLAGAAVFAEASGGRRGAPFLRPGVELANMTRRAGWRAGLSMVIGTRASGSAAVISLDQDLARPFGLPFDSAAVANFVEPARGLEAHGRLVLLPGYLAIESWITDWSEFAGWTYLPGRSWRTALELHTVPLPTGNLEILGRLEAAQRSALLVYDPAPPDDAFPFVQLPAATRVDAYLQIRIIDVRAFIRWEDLLGQDIEELPGRFHRGPRIFYGVKWNLWN
jgi:hypothetical protein